MRGYELVFFKRKFIWPVVAAIVATFLVVACIGTTSLYLSPNRVLAYTASHLLGREVTFGNLQIRWSDTLEIEIDNMHVANRAWGSSPDIFYADHIAASLNRQSLLMMKAKFEQLTITDAHLLLEHNERGVGNWKNTDTPHPPERSPAEEARHIRLSLPTVLNLRIDNSNIKFITSSKAVLRIAFKTLDLNTKTEGEPVELIVDGSYNELPVQMKIEAQSFENLRAADKPFKMDVTAKGHALLLHLDAESMDPVNFDQVRGHLHVDATNVGQAAAYIGGEFGRKWPLIFDSVIERDDPYWRFSAIDGSFDGNPFHDSIVNLQEGARLQPDALNIFFGFDHIDIDRLLKHNETIDKKREGSNKVAWVDLGKDPSELIDATLKAKELHFQSATLSNFNIHGEIANGISGIENVSFGVFGGTASGSLISDVKNENAHVAVTLKAQDIDAAQILQAFKIKKQLLVGRFNLAANTKGWGDTLPALEESTEGEMSLTLKNGGIERWANHLAASDITSLFDRAGNIVPVESLVANVTFKNGIGTLSPFIFKTKEGTLLGQGTIDLPENRMSLFFHTDPSTTSGLALDIPVEVSGKFSDLSVHIYSSDEK